MNAVILAVIMKVSILNAQHTIFEGIVSEAVLPGRREELTILDDHQPIFVVLKKGHVRLKPITKEVSQASGSPDKKKDIEELRTIFINQGLARMVNNELVILAE